MTIAQIHTLIYRLTRKEQTGPLSHEKVDEALHVAQLWLFNNLLPLYGVEDGATEGLSPFKKSLQFATDASGQYTIPEEQAAQRVTGVTVSVYDNAVSRTRWWTAYSVREEGWAERVNSQLNEPTATAPIYRVEGLDTLKFYPEQEHAGVVFFIALPSPPLFKYTVVDRVVTQDEGGSVDLGWKTSFIPKIVLKAVELLGIQLDDAARVQLSDALIKDNA